jgi:heme-degrading monooxygenase HmoA
MPRYMTIGKLTITAGNRAAAERIADQGVAAFEQQAGFENVTFYLDEDRSEYGAVSIWTSREAAERANAELTPAFEQAFGDLMRGSIETHVYEIYEPQR